MKQTKRIWSIILALSILTTLLFPASSFGLAEDEGWLTVKASASTSVNSGMGPQNLVDGNPDTFWSSASSASEYPQNGDYAVLSFEGTASVSQIAVTPRKGFLSTFPKNFKLQYLTAEKEWVDIASYTDYSATEAEQVFTFDQPIETKKVRILGLRYGTDEFNTHYMQLSEMRAYGKIIAPPNPPIWGSSPIAEPYEYVADGSFSGEAHPESPDPLVSYRWDNPTADDPLEIYLQKPVSATTETPESFSGLETASSDEMDILVTGPGVIVVDFGKELAGWLEIDSPDLSGNVTLGVSEYNQLLLHPFLNKNAAPVQYGDTYRSELNAALYEGVRFGFIFVNEFDKPFHITDIRVVAQTKPVNYDGSFHTDNEMLNKIWYTAAYTVRANLLPDYIGAILVDRGDRYSWTGDAHPAQAASLAAFGNFDDILKNLEFTATFHNGFNIESYELYWVLSLIDYYQYSGDRDGVIGLLDQATKRLDHAYQIYGTNPDLEFFGWDERLGAYIGDGLGPELDGCNLPENQNAYKMVSIRAWSEFASMMAELGYSDLASRYQGYAEEKTAELLSDPDWYRDFGMHASADAINADVVSEETARQMAEEHFTDPLTRISFSPFNQHFVLQAMAKAGYYDEAIASILDLWGGQIEYGGTTFFEVFNPEWNNFIGKNDPIPNTQVSATSLAHPWSSGVLAWLSEEVLGIQATSGGFETFSVTPHLGRQLTQVSGSVPTGNGIIEADIDTKAGEASLTVPAGTTACMGIPKLEKEITSIAMNGVPVTDFREDEDFIYLENLTEGSYSFAFGYTGETPAFQDRPVEYPGEFVKVDRETKGSWGGVYGSDGYVLLNGKQTEQLPEYVEDVIVGYANFATWEEKTDDVRALSSNPFNVGERSIGCAFAPLCSMTLDIRLKEQHDTTVALYFMDWDSTEREVAVEMFDGKTKKMVAPLQVLRDYHGGAYLVYRYNDSMRFRIDQVRGANATVSGIFFGEGVNENPIVTSEKIDDQNPRVVYAGAEWTQVPFPGCYMDTFSNTNVANASATLEFEGTGITYIASQEFNRGIVEIKIDGETKAEVDLYSPTAVRQTEAFTIDGLAPGKHTIEVIATGRKNPSATDAYIEVDAFVVTNSLSPAQMVASHLEAVQPAAQDRSLTLPTVPAGFQVSITDSSNPEVIAIDGTITPQKEPMDIEVTFAVEYNGETAYAKRTITVLAQSAQLFAQANGETLTCATVNEVFDMVAITGQDAESIRIYNEYGLRLAPTGLRFTDNTDGTRTWTGKLSIGTVGKGRTLTLSTVDSEGTVTEAGASMTMDIIAVKPLVLSASAEETAVVNTPFTLTVLTNDVTTKLDVYNEFGLKMVLMGSGYEDTAEGRRWTVQIQAGTRGTRSFKVYAKNKFGDISGFMSTNPVTIQG